MANVHDVAAYILRQKGLMPAMKLHKLLYYCQAWSLIWEDKPIFQEVIEAWANGPIVRELYARHRGMFTIPNWPDGDAVALVENEASTIDAVLKFYGDRSSQWLSDLVHREDPWHDARAGLAPGERGSKEITHAAMAEYYGSILAEG